jgi:hypothetical protein
MAEPVYDDENQDHDSLTPEALRKLEEKRDKGESTLDDDRKLFTRDQQESAQKEEDLNQQLRDTWKYARESDAKHESQVGKGYNKNQKQKGISGRIQQWRRRRAVVAGVGAFAALLIAAIVLLFSFLNVFKLDDLMSNIDAKDFKRFNSAMDRRSDKWVQSYLFLRLMQLKGDGVDPDSEYFRANRVDTDNPIKDWYHTMSTSNFEKDLAEKGIVFANRDAGNGFKFSVLEVNGKEVAGLTAGDVRNGNLVNKLRTDPNFVNAKLAEVDLNKPGGSKEARSVIKQIVSDNTRFHQVIKKRQVRKSIANMTGVRDWRFFETTRDKVDNKKITIRDKIVTKAIPQSTFAGKILRCFLGISNCRSSEDPSDPQYQSDPKAVPDANPDEPEIDPDTKDPRAYSAVLKEILSSASIALKALNIAQTLNSLSHIDHGIKSGQLSKGVAVARGIQAMGLYQVFETSRDQMKSGQLTGAEVNQFMQTIGPVSHGEGWTKVIAGQGDASTLTNTAASAGYCNPKNQAAIQNNPAEGNKQFAYLCSDKQIGGTSRAATLENDYKSTIGKILGPIVSAWDSANSGIAGAVLGFINNFTSKLTSVVTGLIEDVLKLIGLQDDLQSLLKWGLGKITAFLGAGPIVNGNEAAPVFANWLVQGGAYTAEASARTNGAAKTNPDTRATAQQTVAQYDAQQQSQMSVFDKYLSLSNPDSAAAKQAFALSETNPSSALAKLTNFGSIFKTIGSTLTQPFSKHVAAASDTGYSGSGFAGIQTYDFPKECLDRDPLSATPKNGTNIQQILGKAKVPDSVLTWDLVNDSDQWYQYVYDKIGDRQDADEIAVQIYNCNLIDTSTRGGLGYIYGYKNDNGLDDNASGSSSNTTTTPDGTLPTGNAKDLATQLLPYISSGKIKCGSAAGGSGPTNCLDIQNTAKGIPIGGNCAVSSLTPHLLGLILGLVKDDGWTLGISAICSNHHPEGDGPYAGHSYGSVADFSVQNGASGLAAATNKKFVDDAAALLSEAGGSFGQIQCAPTSSHSTVVGNSKFTTFSDGCNHQHIRAAP